MERISDHIWLYPYEERLDRPVLGYIGCNQRPMAIEAGHSQAHINAFYGALKAEGLHLPELTAVTHWHWDHTFAMAFVNGLTVAEQRTDAILKELAAKKPAAYQKEMMARDPYVALEYEHQKMRIVPANLVFKDELEVNLGGVHVQLLHIPSPHTEDSVAVLVKEDKVLFIGDASAGPYPDYDHPDPVKLKAFFDALRPLDFETVVYGHSPVESRNEFFKNT